MIVITKVLDKFGVDIETAQNGVEAVKAEHPTLSYEEAIEFQKIKSS